MPTVTKRKGEVTENEMSTHTTSGSNLVDLFFSMGASRDKSEGEIREMVSNAFSEDVELTTKALFYNRDIRGGQGERRFFRIGFQYICEEHPDIARKNLDLIPEYGRWDDLLHVSVGTPVEEDALNIIEEQVQEDCRSVLGDNFEFDQVRQYV